MSPFDLAKLAGYLLMPAGLLWLVLLAAALWAFRRRQRGLGSVLFLVFLLYGAIGSPWLGQWLLGTLERRIPRPDLGRPYDAVFVLGGGSELNRQGEPQLSEGGDRIALAARLWHGGLVKVLVADGSGDGTRNLGEETRKLWLGLGVPESAIRVIPEPCRNTREEVAAYRRMKDAMGWTRVGLVSSAWHLPRVMALARTAGLEATPLPADERSRERSFQIQWLVPQGRGFDWVGLAAWEYLGRWTGR